MSMDKGVIVGLANTDFRSTAAGGVDWKPETNLRIGAFGSLRILKFLRVQAELVYSRKGAWFEGMYDRASIVGRTKIDYLELPLVAKLGIKLSDQWAGSLSAGGFAALRLGAESSVSYRGETVREDIRDQIQKYEAGLVTGAGLEWKDWMLEIRAVSASTNIKKKSYLADGYEIDNRAVSVLLGYRF